MYWHMIESDSAINTLLFIASSNNNPIVIMLDHHHSLTKLCKFMNTGYSLDVPAGIIQT